MLAKPIRLLIVDDDPLVRSSLTLYFSSQPDIEVIGDASNGAEALAFIYDDDAVDVVMADINMPEMDGIALLKRINKMEKAPTFLAMTAIDQDEKMMDILSHGGRGYILKSSTPEFIIQAVKDAYSGGTTVSPLPASRLLQHIPSMKNPHQVQHGDLSSSEHQVLSLLCEGFSNQEIASRANLSLSTVKKYISSLMDRYEATSRLSLAIKAINSGYPKG